MAQNKFFELGPLLLTTTTTTNLMNPPAASGGVNGGSSGQFIVLRAWHITNITGAAATCSLWRSTTGDNTTGKEIAKAIPVPANSSVEFFLPVRFDTANFLVKRSNTANALVLTASGEIGVSG